MSADTPNPDAAGADSGGNADIKALRDAAEQGKRDRQENEQLKRELAFAKAGIDTDSKLGSMLAKTWDGDLDDIESLKAEWAELNPAAGQTSTTPPETAPTPEGFQNPADQQQHRENVSGNGTPTGQAGKPGPNPFDQAFESFHKNGAIPLEGRQEAALGTVLGAYFQGDQRVMFDRNAHLAAAQATATEDMNPAE